MENRTIKTFESKDKLIEYTSTIINENLENEVDYIRFSALYDTPDMVYTIATNKVTQEKTLYITIK